MTQDKTNENDYNHYPKRRNFLTPSKNAGRKFSNCITNKNY